MTAIHLNPVAVSSAALLRAIRAGGWSNASELAKAAGRSPKNIARDLTILRNADLLADGDDIALSDIGDLQLDAIDRAESGEGEPGLPGGDRWPHQVGDIRLIAHGDIRPDPDNAREDWESDEAREELDGLREDIIQSGLLQNLIVRPDGAGGFIIVGGERRWRAIGLAISDDDWPRDRPLPCRVIETDDLGHRLAALSENLKRRNLNPLEKAKAFEGLAEALTATGVDETKVNREIADRVGVTIEHVQQHRSFMKLDEADQQRLTLAKDDPRRLSVSEARKKVTDAAKTEAAREELLAIPPEERLALAEVLHAVSVRGKYSYDSVIVRAGAADSKIGQALTAMGWARFEGPVTYGDKMGHFAVSRGHSVPYDLGSPYWSGSEEERDTALRAHQAEAGHPDRTDYVTEWLNGPFDLTEEGQAVVDEAKARAEAREAEEARREAEREAAEAEKAAAAERQRVVAAQSRDLFAAHRSTPAPAEAVVELAAAADAKLPWRMKFNGDVVAADGELIIGGRTNDRAEARMRLLILAVNAAGGVETPEDEPDPNPELTEEEFIAAMAEAITRHGGEGDAAEILAEFLTDNGVAYGDDGWDWTAKGAERLAVEALAEVDEGEDAEDAYAAADHEEDAA